MVNFQPAGPPTLTATVAIPVKYVNPQPFPLAPVG